MGYLSRIDTTSAKIRLQIFDCCLGIGTIEQHHDLQSAGTTPISTQQRMQCETSFVNYRISYVMVTLEVTLLSPGDSSGTGADSGVAAITALSRAYIGTGYPP